jgi:biopolymer transport protein ExbD
MNVGGNTKRAMADMNVTPLIDVLLVLIITFMVVTNLTPQGLDALAPPSKKSPDGPNTAIVISVDAMRKVTVNSTPVDLSALGAELDGIFKSRNERIVFVQADPALPFGVVAKVIDIAKGANIDKVGLITGSAPGGMNPL